MMMIIQNRLLSIVLNDQLELSVSYYDLSRSFMNMPNE